jgi:hypothetical protein
LKCERGVSRPSAMRELASGNLEVAIPAQDKKAEIGEMARVELLDRGVEIRLQVAFQTNLLASTNQRVLN